MPTIRFSVIVPCRNAGDLLVQAVNSALAQQQTNAGLIEIIVVDDASTDPATARALEAVAAKDSVKVLRHAQQQGVARARNRAIETARGELIAFLDADDVWLPGHLEVHDALHRSARVAFSGSDFTFTDTALAPLIEGFVRHHARKRGSLEEAFRSGAPVELTHPVKSFILTCPAWTGTVVAKRSAIEQVGGFQESLALGEDVHLWIRLAGAGSYAFDPRVTALYRDTPGSLTNSSHQPDQDKWLAEAFINLLSCPTIGSYAFLIRQQAAAALAKHAYVQRKAGNRRNALQSSVRAARFDWRCTESYIELAKTVFSLK